MGVTRPEIVLSADPTLILPGASERAVERQMRLLGIEWFATVCYPEIDIDINQEVRDFFSLFYNVDLTDDQLQSLLNQDQISFK